MNLEKAISMITGTSAKQYEASQVSELDKARIRDALNSLFSGFSLIEWVNGKHLGKSQELALIKIRQIIAEIQNNNSAISFIRNFALMEIKTKVNSLSLNDTSREFCSVSNDKQKQDFIEYANNQINQGMATLKEIIEKYDTTPKTSQPIKKLNTEIINKVVCRDKELEREEREKERTF
jgi:hypothetical protein